MRLMNNGKVNLLSIPAFLSEIKSGVELYYAGPNCQKEDLIVLKNEEARHIVSVMRHKKGETLFVTDGIGNYYKTEIISIEKLRVITKVIEFIHKENNYENVIFCIPQLKSKERVEFALEKCVELGITRFILFGAERSVSKNLKIDRLRKTAISAMKQSLKCRLPEITHIASLEEIFDNRINVVVFEQNSERNFSEFKLEDKREYYFVFGPEGGLTDKEMKMLNGCKQYKLNEHRLRSETAIIAAAVILTAKS